MVSGNGTNTFLTPPRSIDYQFGLDVSADGSVSLSRRRHDGYPSYEIWVYRDSQEPQRLYYYDEGRPGNISKLKGDKDDVRSP